LPIYNFRLSKFVQLIKLGITCASLWSLLAIAVAGLGLPPAALRACSSGRVRFLLLIAEFALMVTTRDEDEESKTRGRTGVEGTRASAGAAAELRFVFLPFDVQKSKLLGNRSSTGLRDARWGHALGGQFGRPPRTCPSMSTTLVLPSLSIQFFHKWITHI